MTMPDDDPIVRRLKALHEAETVRATRDLARSTPRLSSPTIRSSMPRLAPLGVAVVAIGILASLVFVGTGSRLGRIEGATGAPITSGVASAGPAASSGASVMTSPAPSSAPSADPSSAPQHAQSVEGRFRLDFELPKTIWTAGEPIEGLATLSLVDGTSVDLGTSGGGPFGFAYVDPNGKHDVEPAWTSDCRATQLKGDKPMTSGLSKSGGFSESDPDAAFFHAFLNGDPVVRLPAGDWTITAVASFVEEAGCTGNVHRMTASIPIHVLPSADGQWQPPMASSAEASTPSTGPTPSALPEAPRHSIDWRTNVVSLTATNLAIDADGRSFVGEKPILLHSDPGSSRYWTLEATWHEDGVEMRLFIYFAADDTSWWATEIRTYDGHRPANWIEYLGTFFKRPLGQAYLGDLDVTSSDPLPGRLVLDGLSISVHPR